jgi:outer membrane protein assembly factor BamB
VLRLFSISIFAFTLGGIFLGAAGCNSDTANQANVQPASSLWTRTQGIDWPRMLGVNYDSHSPETGILTKWPETGLKVLWTADTGIGYGNGVASQGRWFQFDRFGDVERLDCLNAETGQSIWNWETKVNYHDSYGYNNGPRSSPVVDGDRVYIYGVAGTLACLSVQDGKRLWLRNINDEYNVITNFFGVGASPLVYEDKLLLMVGGSQKGGVKVGGNFDIAAAKPDGSAMVALDKLTGKELYRVGDYLASYSAPVIQKIDGKDTCLALVREGLMAFDPRDGKGEAFHPWRASVIESVNAASPVVWKDRVLITECYEIGCSLLKFTDRQFSVQFQDSVNRKDQVLRSHWSTPLLNGNLVIGSSGRNEPDTDLRCLELVATGDGTDAAKPVVKWTNRNRDRMTGLIVDNHALMLGESGLLQLLELASDRFLVVSEMPLAQIQDPRDGRPLVETPSWAPPVLSHGLLYVRGTTKVVCLELKPE